MIKLEQESILNMKKILIVIDLQKQFKDKNGDYERCLSYIESHRTDYDKIIATVFKNGENTNFIEELHWKEYTEFTGGESINRLEFACDEVIDKYGYGLPIENSSTLCSYNKSEIVLDVIGCDADACVMASCFRLWDANYRFRILSDYVFSTAEADCGFSRENIIAIMKRNFGNCVCSVTCNDESGEQEHISGVSIVQSKRIP